MIKTTIKIIRFLLAQYLFGSFTNKSLVVEKFGIKSK